MTRRITKFGVTDDKELALRIKAIYDEHELRPEPYDYAKHPYFD